MAVKEISVRSGVVAQDNVTSLDGSRYRIRVVYNARVDRYFADLLSEIGVPLIQGFKLVADWNPFRNVLVTSLPDGRIVILNRLGTGISAGEDQLGFAGPCGLFYESASI